MKRIGLMTAMKSEIPDCIPYKRSDSIQHFRMGPNELGVLLSGIGPQKAEKATEKLCAEFKPDLIIVLGFCGSTDPELPPGTLIVAEDIYCQWEKEPMHCSGSGEVKRSLIDSSIDYTSGNLQTFNRAVLSRAGVMEGILGVDMEAYAVARTVRNYAVPTAVIKSVSDILPEKKPVVFPTAALLFRILRNLKRARKSLNAFGRSYFCPD